MIQIFTPVIVLLVLWLIATVWQTVAIRLNIQQWSTITLLQRLSIALGRFWLWLGRRWAWFSSFLAWLNFHELIANAYLVLYAVWDVVSSVRMFSIGYWSMILQRRWTPWEIYAGSGIIGVVLFAFHVWLFYTYEVISLSTTFKCAGFCAFCALTWGGWMFIRIGSRNVNNNGGGGGGDGDDDGDDGDDGDEQENER